MEHGVTPKETLEVDRDEKMDRDTREKIKELIARRQARQWMTRIDKDLKEIRDTRSAIQTKIIMIEARVFTAIKLIFFSTNQRPVCQKIGTQSEWELHFRNQGKKLI